MSTDETKHAAMFSVLDITKVSPATAEALVHEIVKEATTKQTAVWAVERDESMSREQKSKAVHALLDRDLQFLTELHNSNDEFGQWMHGAAHQMMEQCDKDAKREQPVCRTIVFSFMQMVSFGFRLASAHLETQALERSVV